MVVPVERVDWCVGGVVMVAAVGLAVLVWMDVASVVPDEACDMLSSVHVGEENESRRAL